MKTPSGRIHVGSLRGVVIHDLVYKVLLENKVKAHFTWVFEDHDPMDAMPPYLDYDKWSKYLGMPLYMIPSPEPGAKNFGEYYAKEFQKVFESLNCHPQIIWMSEFYRAGKMNDVVKEALDKAKEIRKIYLEVTKVKKPDDWHPFNPICDKCQKISTTYVYKWDGKNVYYRCDQDVTWAKGCGHEGKISPFDGRGKMHWRVEWPAKWKAIGVTVEGGGKDHMTAGGSHDMASIISKKIFNYPVPYPLPYEFIIVGGKKMSSSKGTGTPAVEMAKILPTDLLRFLIVRSPINTTIDFDPYGDAIPNLFDDYDRCLNAYFAKLENNIPPKKEGEVLLDFARIIELSAVKPLPEKRIFLPRFRTVVNLLKTRADIQKFFQEQKGSTLTAEEKGLLNERVTYAQIYLKNYADEEEKIEMTDEISKTLSLSKKEREFLQKLAANLTKTKDRNRDEIQNTVFKTLKEGDFAPRDVFKAFYKVVLGREFGPKAADLILEFGKDKIIKRLREV
jgi:lysyl-tRNA synthetase class 1